MEKSKKLADTKAAALLDREAVQEWGLNSFALVEAAGRGVADALLKFLKKGKKSIVVFAGSGNNGADALVLLKTLILREETSSAQVFLSKTPEENTPLAGILKTLVKMNVFCSLWENSDQNDLKNLETIDLIVDGISGTGLSGEIKGLPKEMIAAVNSARNPKKISIDLPSGCFDGWKQGMSIVQADATLVIEPLKLCLYKPAVRVFAGKIIPVEGIFPQALIDSHTSAELLEWKSAKRRIPKIKPDAYKYERGTVAVFAGSAGFAGAARIAARGAQVVGAGLVRLTVDPEIYSVLASDSDGVMIGTETAFDGRFPPDAALWGPGWGADQNRLPILQKALALKETPLILDADALRLAKNIPVFNGKTILTPHTGELARFLDIPAEAILADPLPILKKTALEKNAVILFKSHVLFIVAPDGRAGIVDGLAPVLSAGGFGDLLAGICAGIAARMQRRGVFDAYTCACTCAALLISAGKSLHHFADPLALAEIVAEKAGSAWLDFNVRSREK